MIALPIGERENEGREFKSRDALNDLPAIAREVVGMLNRPGSGTGTIWVGVGEQDGVAHSIEAIDPSEWDRLWNHLVDTIEPSPDERAVSHEMVAFSGEGKVMRVKVRPSADRGPFAQLKKGGRFYWKRVGPRLRIMNRNEIFGSGTRDQPSLSQRLNDAKERRHKNGRAGLWLHVEADDIGIQTSSAEVARLLREPDLSGNRESGWSAINPYSAPTLRTNKISQGLAAGEPRIDVHQSGAIVLDVPLQSLHWKGPEQEIWAYALIEYVVSTLRLAAKLYATAHDSPGEAGAHLALFGLRGWTLAPGSPPQWFHGGRRATYDLDDLVLEQPVLFHDKELLGNPELAATRLVIPIYESFGFREEDIPPEFDTKAGALIFPK